MDRTNILLVQPQYEFRWLQIHADYTHDKGL